jgi:hypothetical protein
VLFSQTRTNASGAPCAFFRSFAPAVQHFTIRIAGRSLFCGQHRAELRATNLSKEIGALSEFSPCRVSHPDGAKENNMLWTVFVVLLVLWLLGFSLHVAGGLIHLLLVVALVVLVINLLSGRSSAV